MHAVVIVHHLDRDKAAAARDAHREWLQRQSDAGTLLLAGRQNAQPGGVFVLQGASRDELVALCATDPFAVSGAARHEVIDFEAGYGAFLKSVARQ